MARSPAAIFVGAALVLIAATAAVAIYHQLPWIAGLLGGVNAATFLLYGYDKIVAGRGRLRVPELVLHGLALAGGTPAAFLGQIFWRHKMAKGSFQIVFWMIVGVQLLALLGWSVLGPRAF